MAKQRVPSGWRIEGTLGEGGQAQVFKVRRESDPTGPSFAYKLLRKNKGGEKAFQRFRQEIATLQKIDNPGIVKVIDWSKDDGADQYYIMEYVDGARPLSKLVGTPENTFSGNPLKCIDAYIQLLRALGAWNEQGVVHRDLSLANVLVAQDQTIKVIDFGLCQVDEGGRVTLSEEAVGTPHYMAPECEGYSSTKITFQSDLYSVGKILWSIITNRTAFPREQQVFNDLALSRVLPDVPLAWHLHHVFENTIRHDPTYRYLNMDLAIKDAVEIRDLITCGALPLERLASNVCPICRRGDMNTVSVGRGPMTVGRVGNEPYSEFMGCPVCGFAVLRTWSTLRDSLKRREALK
jgi:eukaryotic-like serine/threonine-protein kinase